MGAAALPRGAGKRLRPSCAGATRAANGISHPRGHALERLIGRVEAAGLPGRARKQPGRKLSNAQGSLARGQINGAIGKIQAFIAEVEAQRGKQIDEADADAWIAAAETILDMLSAS